MSYCRFSAGDVYLYHDVDGTWHCCACFLIRGDNAEGKKVPKLKYAQDTDVILTTRSAAILHLRHHKLMGHHVPGYAEKRLMEELRDVGEGNGKKRSFKQYQKDVKKAQARFKRLAKKWKKQREKNAKRKA